MRRNVKNSSELSVAVCVSTLRGDSHVEDGTLRVQYPRARAVKYGLACLCESCENCVRLCACGRACVSVVQDHHMGVIGF